MIGGLLDFFRGGQQSTAPMADGPAPSLLSAPAAGQAPQSLLQRIGIDLSNPQTAMAMQMIGNGMTPSVGRPRAMFEGVQETGNMAMRGQLAQEEADLSRQQRAEAAQAKTANRAWLEQNAPDLVPLLDAGAEPATVINQAIQRMQPKGPDYMAVGGQLFDQTSGEWLSPPGGGAQEVPAAFQTLDLRAQAAGLQPGTPDYQQFMAAGGRSESEGAAVQRIDRMSENLMATGDFVDPMDARNIATGIVDGRLKSDRNPVTGELQVVDMATGRVVYGQGQARGEAAKSGEPVASAPGRQFGEQYPNAPEAFGVTGAAQNVINTIGDVTGVGAPYPDVQQTQADFDVLRESLLNDVASAYPRQPPSWLLQEIRTLTPVAGSVLQGAGGAQTRMRSLGRHFENELAVTRQSLQRELSPTNRQELEARAAGLEAAVARTNGALAAFDNRPSGDVPTPQTQADFEALPSGSTYIDPDDGRTYRKP